MNFPSIWISFRLDGQEALEVWNMLRYYDGLYGNEFYVTL